MGLNIDMVYYIEHFHQKQLVYTVNIIQIKKRGNPIVDLMTYAVYKHCMWHDTVS